MLGNGKVREIWSYRDCLTGTNIVRWKRAVVGLDLQASSIVNYFRNFLPTKELRFQSKPFSIITQSYWHLHLLLDFLPVALSMAIPTVKIAKKKGLHHFFQHLRDCMIVQFPKQTYEREYPLSPFQPTKFIYSLFTSIVIFFPFPLWRSSVILWYPISPISAIYVGSFSCVHKMFRCHETRLPI